MLLYIYIIGIIVLLPIAYGGLMYAPWVPTRSRDLERIKQLSGAKKGDIFYELGSGDGRVSTYIAKHTPARVIGYEIAFPVFIASFIRKIISRLGKNKLQFRLANFFKHSLHDANVIFTYGMPEHLANKLRDKLENELQAGTKIVSYVFKIQGWEPVEYSKPKKTDMGIYVYEIGKSNTSK